MHKIHDLFLLMFNLSQMRDKAKIIQLFHESISELFHPFIFNYSEQALLEMTYIEEITANKIIFGYIFSNATPSNEIRVLIENAIQMLAVLLDRLRIENALEEKADSLETIAQKRLVEINSYVKELEAAKLASLNLIEDLKNEIIERNKVQEALGLGEEKFRLAFQTSPDSININRLEDGMYIEINKGFTSILGYTANEVIGKSSIEIDIWNNLEDRAKLVEGLKANGKVENLEAQFRKKDGNVIYGLMSASIINLYNEPHIISIARDISEIKKAQLELQTSEIRFRTAFENSAVGMCMTSTEGHFLQVNKRLTNILGYSESELITMTFQKITFAEDVKISTNYISDALENQNDINHFEKRYLRKDGEIIWAEVSSTLLRDSKQNPLYFITHIIDVTERKKAELMLKMREDKLSAIIRVAPTGIGLTVDRCFSEVNDLFCEMVGYKREELIGKNSALIYTNKEEYEYVGKYKYEQIKAKGTGTLETKFKKKDGQIIDVLMSSTPLDKDDISGGVSFTALDITDRKKSEESLRESEDRYRKLLINLDAGVIVHAPDTSIQLNNKRASELLGLSDDQMRGKLAIDPHWKFIHENKVAFKLEEYPINRVINTKKAFQNLILGVVQSAKNDIVWLTVNGLPVFDEKGNITEVLISFIEISEQKRAHEEIKKLNEELELRVAQRTAQLEAVNKELESFIYSVSHDLRAPLRSIMGFSQIISRRHIANLNEEGLEYFGFILEASQNMANLIEDLLHFSRMAKNQIDKEWVDLKDLFESVTQNLNQDIMEQKAKIIYPENMPEIPGDRSLFSQIFSNLILNAIVYHREGVNPEIEISVEEDNNYVNIKVKDNGQGIPKQHHEKIFNIFQRLHTNDTYPGTGIGLSIVKKAVAALGGTITLESELNSGTTFKLTFTKDLVDL